MLATHVCGAVVLVAVLTVTIDAVPRRSRVRHAQYLGRSTVSLSLSLLHHALMIVVRDAAVIQHGRGAREQALLLQCLCA